MNWLILFAIIIFCIVAYQWYERRLSRKLREENSARARLGLPALTREEFEIDVVEKSADYRHKINQHM